MSRRTFAILLLASCTLATAGGCGETSSTGAQACTADSDCTAPGHCNAGACSYGCIADSECDAGKFCQVLTGVCVPGCRDDSACQAGEVCQHGGCLSADADSDGDGYPARIDCDDQNAAVNPAATEECNGVDDNCNAVTDEGLPFGPLADRQDGVCQSAHKECGGSAGWVEPDYASLPNFEQTETSCDGRDNDCDGQWDEGLVPPPATKHEGVCLGAQQLCKGLNGWEDPDYTKIAGYESYESGDCDGIDSDCTGRADEQWDSDHDGYYTGADSKCVAVYTPLGLVDCDDTLASYNTTCVIHVNDDATGLNDGTSWPNAVRSLQDALALYKTGYQIWVAAGTYRPDQGVGKSSGDRNASFQLVQDVSIYGGFAGTESALAARDWNANRTTLSGDLVGDDGPSFGNRTDNSEHVLRGASGALLDGVWVMGGNGSTAGGGLYNIGPSMNVTIRNCTFASNSGGQGGAIYSYWDSGPTIIDSRFVANRSTGSGGAVFANWSSEPTVYGGLFVGNSAGSVGGAIAIEWSATANFVNCTFASNSASSGGALSLDSRADAAIVNSVFWSNGATPFDGAAFVTSYSCLQLGALGTGNSTLTQDPFVSLTGADATAGNLDDDLHLVSGSACRESGSNAAVPAELTVDLDGNPRIHGTVDRGVYEYP